MTLRPSNLAHSDRPTGALQACTVGGAAIDVDFKLVRLIFSFANLTKTGRAASSRLRANGGVLQTASSANVLATANTTSVVLSCTANRSGSSGHSPPCE